MEPIRVFYRKTDTAKYISHLDINRCFQRADETGRDSVVVHGRI